MTGLAFPGVEDRDLQGEATGGALHGSQQPASWARGQPWEQPGQEPFCLLVASWSLEKSPRATVSGDR